MENTAPNTAPKPFVFVLMPFANVFNDVYEFGIRPACEDVGAYCERVDEQIFEGTILQRLYNQIAKADVIVADMTERNPNVFYETGYAHALGKRVILLTQRDDDIPFDLKHYPHIVYGGSIRTLKEELKRRVDWYLSHPNERVPLASQLLTLFMNKQELLEDRLTTIGWEIFLPSRRIASLPGKISAPTNYTLDIVARNDSGRMLTHSQLVLGLVMPEGVGVMNGDILKNPIALPDGQKLYSLKPFRIFFPEAWQSWALTIRPFTHISTNTVYCCTLKISSELGTHNILFEVAFRVRRG